VKKYDVFFSIDGKFIGEKFLGNLIQLRNGSVLETKI